MDSDVVKIKVTVLVTISNYEYSDPQSALEEFITETDYTFNDTETLSVIDTQIIDSELV